MSNRPQYYASDILSTVTQPSGSAVKSITALSEGTITGAIIGTVGGVFYGIHQKKNLYLTGFIGMLIGGVVSRIIVI